nr:MAG TPA: hypothetical protein [Caudoviricetes sp.]
MLKELFEQFVGAGAEFCHTLVLGKYKYISPTVTMVVYIDKPRIYSDIKLRELIHNDTVKIVKIELW